MDPDRDHLRLLSIGHLVVGAIGYLFALAPLLYVAIGAWMLRDPAAWADNGSPPPAGLGWAMVGLGLVGCLLALAFSTCVVLAGRFLGRRRHRTFCTVIAGLETLFFPVGTALGVLALVVLLRPSVRDLFEGAYPPAP